jgi:hydroxypyruvate isomerase
MKFCANVSLLFGEHPFLERFGAVRAAGLDAVEFWWPPENALPQLAGAVRDAGLDVALFNFYAGDMAAGDRGLLSDPDRHEEFRANVPYALELARELGCSRLNALVGVALPRYSHEEQLDLAVQNLRWAADQAEPQGAMVLVEPVNTIENGSYLVSRTDEGLELIDRVGRDNVLLQYDAYHMQRMEGNIVATLRRCLDRIGHVQVADSPDRGQPGTGEIAYHYVLEVLQELGYDGYVGLEYKPIGSTLDSLAWLEGR